MLSKTTLALTAGIALTGLLATGVAAYADGGRHGPRDGGMHRGGFAMMKMLDTNQDGKLTQAEIDQARKDRLAKFDTDKDGKLNLAEFEAVWLDFTRKRMVDAFQRLDENGDAQVTEAEYLEPTKRMVTRMDRNDDGELSRDDMRKNRHHDGDRKHHGKRD
ncbi:MAG: EF-hand domain-containing protein [Alphaproteobacteria bacterium]